MLVVDDDEAIRQLVARTLEAKQYEVLVAPDGRVAVDLIGRPSGPPDLLIFDVMMPGIDGFRLARVVKARPASRTTPIIFLTGRAQPADILAGINAGARHYMTKPFRVGELVTKVERILGT